MATTATSDNEDRDDSSYDIVLPEGISTEAQFAIVAHYDSFKRLPRELLLDSLAQLLLSNRTMQRMVQSDSIAAGLASAVEAQTTKDTDKAILKLQLGTCASCELMAKVAVALSEHAVLEQQRRDFVRRHVT